jgi:hypothetical protein
MPRITGVYRFAPPLDASGNRTRRDGSMTDGWLIIQCEPDVGRYLRQLRMLERRASPLLSDPLWGAHVSIVRGESLPNPAAWKDCEGRIVEFEYQCPPQEIGEYVFFPVICQDALNYRERLGLPREPQWPLHLTFGNFK